MSRLVVVLFGPPGAGKTTIARASGLTIYDRDDPQWKGRGETFFRSGISKLAEDVNANAVVIRSGATSSARSRTLREVDATHAYLILTPPDVCHYRVGHRRREDRQTSQAAIDTWYAKLDRQDGLPDWPGSWEQVLATPPVAFPARTHARARKGAGVAHHPRPIGAVYRRNRQAVLELSDICHLCGHPGARQVDEIIPRALGGDRNDPYNLAPAHGGGDRARGLDNPCPTCGLRCNQVRGARPIVRGDEARSQDW